MKVRGTKFPEVKIIEINEYPDEKEMRAGCIITYQWSVLKRLVNSNAAPFLSESEIYVKRLGTLRGLYYDLPPRSGDVLMRCVSGKVQMAVVDLRQDSVNYCSWLTVELSNENRCQLYIPAGFAYGFLTCSDNVVLQYKSTSYVGNHARTIINYSDERIGIKWLFEPSYMSAETRFAPGIEKVELEMMMDWAEENASSESDDIQAELEGTYEGADIRKNHNYTEDIKITRNAPHENNTEMDETENLFSIGEEQK